MHGFEHFVFLFNAKFFYAEVKFSLVELGRLRQYPNEDLETYMRRFHDRALDCCDPNRREDGCRCLPLWDDRRIPNLPKKSAFSILLQVEGSR